nr:immunoglobulin light chain junction region [Macaca mulatta]MOW39112.1 immunoglobulin light chain junction region [Macaca mulatta]MOW39143.1 immunoglobulin light chain junction region [Macaca mulatta]MOW39151.1 immunoglobulin light chain junction region [Macaca mulatta]MOW39156.1 immunoglobulin light chain junction region [Macaca mulatta]
CMQGRKYPYSF